MIQFDLAQKVLMDIIVNDVTFKQAIKEKRNDPLFKEHASMVTALVGCELRHHEFISYLTKDFELKEEERILVYLGLANAFFLKRFDKKEVTSYMKTILVDSYSEEIDKLLNYEGSLVNLSPKHDNKNNLQSIAMRFNVPEYLLKMWTKHYGLGIVYRFLKRNIRNPLQYYRVNTMKTTEGEILSNYPDFQKTAFENILTYNGEKNIRSIPLYHNYEIFAERVAIKTIMDKVFDNSIQYMTVYSGKDDSLVREAYLRANKEIGLSVAVPSLDERPELLRLFRIEKAKNVNLFEATDFSMMKAAITSEQDLIVVMPRSSSFDYIRLYPDYLLHFKRDSLDGLINEQKLALDNFANYLHQNGTLLYMVDTLNKKESEHIINEFLKAHEDFELVEAKQLISSQEESTTIYYAILKKKNND